MVWRFAGSQLKLGHPPNRSRLKLQTNALCREYNNILRRIPIHWSRFLPQCFGKQHFTVLLNACLKNLILWKVLAKSTFKAFSQIWGRFVMENARTAFPPGLSHFPIVSF
jgi:hypothetical protein